MIDKPHLNRAIADEYTKVETTLCLSTKTIVITEDRLELRIQDGMEKLSARDSWIAPFGIVLTCLLTLFTADFKNFSWVTGGTLKGVFICVTALSLVWLVTSLFRINQFGRREFMTSIWATGSQYYLSVAIGGSDKQTADSTKAAGQATPLLDNTLWNTLQCRQCGTALPDQTPGQIARCFNCGTVN